MPTGSPIEDPRNWKDDLIDLFSPDEYDLFMYKFFGAMCIPFILMLIIKIINFPDIPMKIIKPSLLFFWRLTF